jgi:hypothetical protein
MDAWGLRLVAIASKGADTTGAIDCVILGIGCHRHEAFDVAVSSVTFSRESYPSFDCDAARI